MENLRVILQNPSPFSAQPSYQFQHHKFRHNSKHIRNQILSSLPPPSSNPSPFPYSTKNPILSSLSPPSSNPSPFLYSTKPQFQHYKFRRALQAHTKSNSLLISSFTQHTKFIQTYLQPDRHNFPRRRHHHHDSSSS